MCVHLCALAHADCTLPSACTCPPPSLWPFSSFKKMVRGVLWQREGWKKQERCVSVAELTTTLLLKGRKTSYYSEARVCPFNQCNISPDGEPPAPHPSCECIQIKKERKYYTDLATLCVMSAAVILSSAARIWIQGSEHNLPRDHSRTKSSPLPPKPKEAYCNLAGCSPPRLSSHPAKGEEGKMAKPLAPAVAAEKPPPLIDLVATHPLIPAAGA